MERELAERLRGGLESGAVDIADILDAADALERLVSAPDRPDETNAMRLSRLLREASRHTLMDAARGTVSEAADEIDRLLVVIDCYARSSAAAAAELTELRLRLNAANNLISEQRDQLDMLVEDVQAVNRKLRVAEVTAPNA